MRAGESVCECEGVCDRQTSTNAKTVQSDLGLSPSKPNNFAYPPSRSTLSSNNTFVILTQTPPTLRGRLYRTFGEPFAQYEAVSTALLAFRPAVLSPIFSQLQVGTEIFRLVTTANYDVRVRAGYVRPCSQDSLGNRGYEQRAYRATQAKRGIATRR